jgi:hypothetical protein
MKYQTSPSKLIGGHQNRSIMKTLPLKTLALLGSATLCAQSSFGALYSTDFNTDDTANWTVNDPALSDIAVDFFYDYSAIGIPAAPNGSGTRGLKMTANNSGAVFSGFSVSPTGQNFSGAYRVSFDMWQNYVGPVGPGGSGTTQLSLYGIGTTGTSAAWIGNTGAWGSGANGIGFGTTLDGGSAADFRVYSSAATTSYPSGNPVYQSPGGTINESGAYYTSFFTSQSAPGAQLSLFPNQTGSTSPGETSFTWRRVTIEVDGAFANWSIDGLPLATVDLTTVTLGGGNIFFGHNDTNAGSSSDPNDVLLNVTLIDNIEVVVVPEPSSAALLGLGALAWFARRRS